MRKPLAATFAILLTLLATATPAQAWNGTGHMTVGYLAWQQLDATQQKRAAEILKHHPHYQQFLVADVPAGVDPGEWSFMKAATWPDFVRPSYPGRAPKSPSITKYHQANWHYIDYYFVLPADKDKVKAPESTSSKATTQPVNAVQAIENSMAKLAADGTSDEDRAVYLAWLLHLVGDIHQPCHACSMVSTRFPKGDKGGNDQAVRTGTRVINLHAFWDDLLGTNEQYRAIAAAGKRIAAAARNLPEANPELQTDRTPESWAKESHDWAVSVVYMGGELETAEYRAYQRKEISEADVPAIPLAYEDNARALAQERVVLASYRLAELLRDLLK
jgi:hypothetical protein